MRYKYSKRSVMRDVSLRLEILDFPVKSMFCAERASSRSIFHRTQFLMKKPGAYPGSYIHSPEKLPVHISSRLTSLKRTRLSKPCLLSARSIRFTTRPLSRCSIPANRIKYLWLSYRVIRSEQRILERTAFSISPYCAAEIARPPPNS